MKICISFTLWAIVLCGHFPPAIAAQFDCLYRVVHLVNQASAKRPPGEEMLARAREFYLSGNSDSPSRDIFTLALDHELQQLPEELQARIRETLNHAIIRQESPHLHGEFEFYDPDLDGPYIFISLPKRFMGTEIQGYLLFHEFFHQIQWELVAKSTGKDIRALQREHNIPMPERQERFAPDEIVETNRILDTFGGMGATVKGRYLIEAGAIMAEWKLLRLIPDSRREALLELIKSEPNLVESRRQLLLRVFRPPPPTAREYLEREHAARRYDWDTIRRKLQPDLES